MSWGRIQVECGLLSDLLQLPGGARVESVDPTSSRYGAYVGFVIEGPGLRDIEEGVDIPLYRLTLTRVEASLEEL